MEVVYITDPSFVLHDTGPRHPERPARLEAVQHGVELARLDVVEMRPPVVDRELLELVHVSGYIDAIERFCRAGGGALDPDTFATEASWEAALRAAGSGPLAVEVLENRDHDRTALLGVRPPGHHALADRAMGFCLFNNIAITAAWLATRGERVAIVDWDVHHGNGTQAMFESRSDILYVSLHQYPFYPGGGAATEAGVGDGVGTVVNLPMPALTGGDVYRAGFSRVVEPVVGNFTPDWILVSAGFDAHEADQLAELRLTGADYRMMASSLRQIAPPSRIITFLEGGYDLTAIADSVAAALEGLFDLEGTDDQPSNHSPSQSWEALERTIEGGTPVWGI